ncbi:MAG: DUF4919 domain-containing protein [Spirulina sp.]
MKELFDKFLELSDRESYLAVRTAIVSSKSYDPYSDEIDEIDELLSMGKLEEALQKLFASMPNLLLSPRAHLMRSCIAKQSNDEQVAQTASVIAATCYQGILATGDGSKDSPYIVVRITDEYDILQYLDKQIEMQSLYSDKKQHFDKFECKDGTEIWFDITDVHNKLLETLNS